MGAWGKNATKLNKNAPQNQEKGTKRPCTIKMNYAYHNVKYEVNEKCGITFTGLCLRFLFARGLQH